jgi:Prenyltransferase and squalene oxidase repeat
MRPLRLLPLLLLVAGAARAGDAPSTSAVQRAIARGADFLRARFQGGFADRSFHDEVEIVMLTFAHAGVSHDDPVFQAGLKVLETTKLRYTYRVSTLAMVLAQLDPWRYRQRLADCAQWLVDSQLPDGSWGYPGRIRDPHLLPPGAPAVTEGEGGSGGGSGPPDTKPVEIQRRTDPAALEGVAGDFSNTQFALLGLRACRDARVRAPEATWQAALDYMVRYQHDDGGWGYVQGTTNDDASYASLTCAGAVGAALCLHALGKDGRHASVVQKSLGWLAANWDPTRNVGIDRSSVIGPSSWQYYHLYAVERTGRILDLKRIGAHAWYAEGATWLLSQQRPDGSWKDENGGNAGPHPGYLDTADTCFAILFLSLATPPLTRGD